MKHKDLNVLFLNFVKKPDDRTFEIFINASEKHLKKKIRYYLDDDSDIDEIYQMTIIKLRNYEQNSEFHPDISNVISWIFSKIAYGFILHLFRERKRFTSLDVSIVDEPDKTETAVFNESNPNPEKLLIIKEKLQEIHRSIFKLKKDKYQDIIILNNFTNFDIKNIANIMGQKYSTVRTWHRNAKAALQKILRKSNLFGR